MINLINSFKALRRDTMIRNPFKRWDFWVVLLVMVLAKSLRDVDLFRWTISWFSMLPDTWEYWLRRGIGVIDWFHISDGILVAAPVIYIFYLHFERLSFVKMKKPSLWKVLLYYGIFWLIFYTLFNMLYHLVWTLPEYRDYPIPFIS